MNRTSYSPEKSSATLQTPMTASNGFQQTHYQMMNTYQS